MTDPHPHGGAAEPGLPAPTFFDPSFERLPAPVAAETNAEGPLLLVFDPRADHEWLADAAVALATGWQATGRRTVLADLSLDDPFLGDRLGMPSQEGIVDIFLYGASLARSARVVPGRGFVLISAGTFTEDSTAILRHPRWEQLVSGFRSTGAALLLFVPADAPALDAIARHAGEAILLGGDGVARDAALPLALAGVRVRAHLAPPRGVAAAAALASPRPGASPVPPAGRFPEPEPGQPWTQPAGTAAAAGAASPPAAAVPVPEPGWEEPKPAKRRRAVSPLLLFLLLLALAAAALWFGPQYVEGFPDVVPATLRGTAQAEAAPAPRRSGPVAAAGEELPYSVQVSNYQSAQEAAAFISEQSRRFPEAQFFVVPEEQGGMLWYKVMAGMVGDTTAVLALRDRLLEADVADEEVVGGRYDLVQRRPLAFELGEFRDAEAARARARELSGREIPAYVSPVPYTDGTERWKVYAGAFPDSTRAEALRRTLAAARLPTRLVARAGRPPAAPK
ncbi:MAG TPA: SPOR domain-containing protein [Longimicrobium sp.]|nr:SPOR domain-containing protein [Longimicrobium sp.]